MPTVVRSPITAIVRALLDVLAKYPPVPRWRVKLWRDGADLPPFADDGPDLVVQVGAPLPDEAMVAGAGRVDTRLTRLITTTLRTRCEADEASADPIRLLDDAIGHLPLEESVLGAMQMFAPTDTAGNELLVQPARLVPTGELPPRPVPKAGNWTASSLVWEIIYEASLDQSRQ